jgi:AAA domain
MSVDAKDWEESYDAFMKASAGGIVIPEEEEADKNWFTSGTAGADERLHDDHDVGGHDGATNRPERARMAAAPELDELLEMILAVHADPLAGDDPRYPVPEPELTPERIAAAAEWQAGHAASLAQAGYPTQEDYERAVAAMQAPDAQNVVQPATSIVAVGRPHARVVLTLAEMLVMEIPTPPSRVAGLLPGEGFGILAGPRKHGKTLTELQLGLCVAGGAPFLGRAVSQTPVLIIEEEGAARAMQDRLRGQAEALGVPADAPLHIAHRQRFRLDHPGDVAEIDELIATTGAGLVIIGPLAQVAAIDENSNSTDGMGPIVRTMTDLAARHRALVKLVHHLRKPVGASLAPKSVDEFFYRVRGADALVAGVDVALGLWREPEATEGTLYVLARDGENVRIPLLFDARSLTFSVNTEPDDPMAADVARFVEKLADRPGRWYTGAEMEGATGWGRTKVATVGMYAFGEKRAEQRTAARNAREWRVAEPFLGGAE